MSTTKNCLNNVVLILSHKTSVNLMLNFIPTFCTGKFCRKDPPLSSFSNLRRTNRSTLEIELELRINIYGVNWRIITSSTWGIYIWYHNTRHCIYDMVSYSSNHRELSNNRFGFDVCCSMEVAKEFVLEIGIMKQQNETTTRDLCRSWWLR